ncbi:MAG: electron transfer flavoprotein subunit alpha/FixB family protein [Candidatus Thermoplasmatota archaeon]
MKILVFCEFREGKIKKASFEALGKAQELRAKVEAMIIGYNTENIVNEIAEFGAEKIYIMDGKEVENYSVEAYSRLIVDVIKENSPDLILSGGTAMGKELMPRVAAKLNFGFANDCIDVGFEADDIIVKKYIYAGKAIIRMKISKPAVITLRPNVFSPIKAKKEFSVVKLPFKLSENELRCSVKETLKAKGEKIELTEANIIVSGGKGLKEGGNFSIIEELADAFGAGVGASRAAVDAGWKPHSYQVGQTGKVVSPNLYIACGISGAIQHLAGMGTSKCIVAINKDPNAPIFKYADYGIVGDLFQIVPVLTEEVKKMNKGE